MCCLCLFYFILFYFLHRRASFVQRFFSFIVAAFVNFGLCMCVFYRYMDKVVPKGEPMRRPHEPQDFLRYCKRRVCQTDPRNPSKQFLVFAWNEWGEGAALERSITFPSFGYGEAFALCRKELLERKCASFDGHNNLPVFRPCDLLYHAARERIQSSSGNNSSGSGSGSSGSGQVLWGLQTSTALLGDSGSSSIVFDAEGNLVLTVDCMRGSEVFRKGSLFKSKVKASSLKSHVRPHGGGGAGGQAAAGRRTAMRGGVSDVV
jgi:hypothetical protein